MLLLYTNTHTEARSLGYMQEYFLRSRAKIPTYTSFIAAFRFCPLRFTSSQSLLMLVTFEQAEAAAQL